MNAAAVAGADDADTRLAPELVFAWGNPGRGDDALGPLFIEAVESLRLPGVACLTDFQLQVEHALDLVGRRRVLFVDASTNARSPFELRPLSPKRDASFTSHAMSPEALLQVFVDLERRAPPQAWLLAIRGVQWELGQGLSDPARSHLDDALAWFRRWLPAG